MRTPISSGVWHPTARRPPGRWRRGRQIAALAAAIALIPALASYARMMVQPSDTSLGIRTVEWLRGNGARRLVNDAENFYYSLNAPAKGGTALRALPKQAGVGPTVIAARHRIAYYRPPRIRPIIHPALRGEGVWHADVPRRRLTSSRADHKLPS